VFGDNTTVTPVPMVITPSHEPPTPDIPSHSSSVPGVRATSTPLPATGNTDIPIVGPPRGPVPTSPAPVPPATDPITSGITPNNLDRAPYGRAHIGSEPPELATAGLAQPPAPRQVEGELYSAREPVGSWPNPPAPRAPNEMEKPFGYWPDPPAPVVSQPRHVRRLSGPGYDGLPRASHQGTPRVAIDPPQYYPHQFSLVKPALGAPPQAEAPQQRARHRQVNSSSDSEWDSPTLPRKRSGAVPPPTERHPVPLSHPCSDSNVPKYNGKYDVADFLAQFECVAEDHGWNYVEMGRRLSRCLTDEARAVLTTLDRPLRRDYMTLCEALTGLHSTPGGEGLQRDELQQAKRAEGQDPNKFGRELRRLGQRAYPKGDLPELVLVQIFIRGLNDAQMERHVGLQGPQTLQEAIRHACNFEAYSGMTSARKPKAANVAKVSNNQATEQTSKAPTSTSHLEKMVSDLGERLASIEKEARQASGVTCFACGGKGHFARNCPHPSQRAGPRAVHAVQPSSPYAVSPAPYNPPMRVPPLMPPPHYQQPPMSRSVPAPEERNSLNY